MTAVPNHPEIPYPFPPELVPPRRHDPVMVPVVDLSPVDAREQLLRQRRLLVTGPLDRQTTTALSAQLMVFDGQSSRDVEIVVNSAGGPLSDIFVVLDVIELMRARVSTTCFGSARGTAAALVACGTGERRASPHATFSLRCRHDERIGATDSDITRRAAEISAMRTRLTAAVAVATGRDAALIAAELEHGQDHDARTALQLGILDTIIEPPERAPRS